MLDGPSNSIIIPDGAPLSPYQLENLRNFIAAIEEMGIPTFETSDLEQVSIEVLDFVRMKPFKQ